MNARQKAKKLKKDSLAIAEIAKKLKPCPICGCKAYIHKVIDDGFYYGWTVGCPLFWLNDGRHGVDENAPFEDIPPNQDETVSLTKDETDSFLKVIEERNFYSLPSSHPEDSTMWLDGDMTFVFGDNGENSHLIKHRCPSERYDIYHIQKAVESLTEKKIDVKYGGVFIDYGYNNQ